MVPWTISGLSISSAVTLTVRSERRGVWWHGGRSRIAPCRHWPVLQKCHLSRPCTAKLVLSDFSSVHSVPEMCTHSRLLPCCLTDLYLYISPSLCSCKSSSISILIQMKNSPVIYFFIGQLNNLFLHTSVYNTIEIVWLCAHAHIRILAWPSTSQPCGAVAQTSRDGNCQVSRRQRFSNNWRWQLIHHGRGIRSTE